MTNDQKAIETLARCGHFSRVGAADFVKRLEAGELEQLVAMHDALQAADTLPPKKPGEPLAADGVRQAVLAKAAGVGERFRALSNAIHDRLYAPHDESPTEAAAPLVGTGEP